MPFHGTKVMHHPKTKTYIFELKIKTYEDIGTEIQEQKMKGKNPIVYNFVGDSSYLTESFLEV